MKLNDQEDVSSCKRKATHHLTRLELVRNRHNLLHILAEPKVFEGLRDVLARDRLLGVFLGDFVGFGGDHGDELDAALDQQVAGFFGEGHGLRALVGGFGGEDFVDDLLDGCLGEGEVIVAWEGSVRLSSCGVLMGWFALYEPPMSLSDMLGCLLCGCAVSNAVFFFRESA